MFEVYNINWGILGHIWNKYLTSGIFTEEIVREELIFCFGEGLNKVIADNPDDFKELCCCVSDFIVAAEKKHYSGLIGAIYRLQRKPNKCQEKYKKIL